MEQPSSPLTGPTSSSPVTSTSSPVTSSPGIIRRALVPLGLLGAAGAAGYSVANWAASDKKAEDVSTDTTSDTPSSNLLTGLTKAFRSGGQMIKDRVVQPSPRVPAFPGGTSTKGALEPAENTSQEEEAVGTSRETSSEDDAVARETSSGNPIMFEDLDNRKITMKKPRLDIFLFTIDYSHNEQRSVRIVAFSYPGYPEEWDNRCQAGFLSNSFPLKDEIVLSARKKHIKGQDYIRDWGKTAQSFRNAEAAFQALKFWSKASDFTKLGGQEAIEYAQKLGESFGLTYFGRAPRIPVAPDKTYAGKGSEWNAMLEVLKQKFGTEVFEKKLKETDNAFLLNHKSTGGDVIWSDGNDGTGKNWLGMQLMLLRDTQSNHKGTYWTNWLTDMCAIDINTGELLNRRNNLWERTVKEARDAVVANLR